MAGKNHLSKARIVLCLIAKKINTLKKQYFGSRATSFFLVVTLNITFFNGTGTGFLSYRTVHLATFSSLKLRTSKDMGCRSPYRV